MHEMSQDDLALPFIPSTQMGRSRLQLWACCRTCHSDHRLPLRISNDTVTKLFPIIALEVGHVDWRRVLPCASSNGPQDTEGILHVTNCPVISALFNPQFGAGPFERLIAIVVLAIAPLSVPPGVEFHGTAPAILGAYRRRDRELEAFRCQQKRLAVKVSVPGVDRSIRRGEQLYQARPDLRERWRAGDLGIGVAGDFRGGALHGDIRFAERLVEYLAVLVHYGDFDDLEASVLQLPCRFRIQQQERRPLFKERLQLRFYPKPHIDPAEIDAAGDAVTTHLAIAHGVVHPAIIFLETMRRIIGATTLTGMLLRQHCTRFGERGELL